MAATVIINRWTGAGPTKTDITGINSRLQADDTHTTAGTSNPVRVPTSGTNYSYWANTRLSASSSPAGTINNIKWFTDGANNLGTGLSMKVQTASVYGRASGVSGTSGDQLDTTNYAAAGGTLAGAPSDAFGYTSGSPLSVTGSISNPSTGDFGDFVVYQIEVISTAGPGASTQETLTWRYDET